LYKRLQDQTSERLTVFVDSGKYLTPLEEHDLVALTAQFVQALNTHEIQQIVTKDPTISEDERATLQLALDQFVSIAQTSASALGNPRWRE
jgi:hypothetical protein